MVLQAVRRAHPNDYLGNYTWRIRIHRSRSKSSIQKRISTMSYPIVSRIEELAHAFNARPPREGYEKQLEAIFAKMRLDDKRKDQVFDLALNEPRFPSVGRLREIALTFAQYDPTSQRVTHVSFQCPTCNLRYAVAVIRLEVPSESDVFECEGVRRVGPDTNPPTSKHYEYEKCEKVFSAITLANHWREQGEGLSIAI